ncbi:nucleotidyltransferase family protein [Pelagicoccus albus]|uniref:Nucleotidyltransferase family protein n=1 Tax=Pelagicoccus albus TaxID=415222 RepID=A0A7X1B814_9BACT|nr:nucleotidyltransferase family protein [Pelagicoccus albus]MBC2607394.1 nucleotidyltransferase family protein [Pelagicoccus albus]
MKSYPDLACVFLAAGLSRRFGVENKLLDTVGGMPMARRSLLPFLSLGLKDIIVVLGHEAAEVRACLEDLPVRFVLNESYREGMGASVACGFREMRNLDAKGCLVALGDLPGLRGEDVDLVCSAFAAACCEKVTLPRFEGVNGHPVCFPRRLFSELEKLSGDSGARNIVKREKERIVVPVVHAGCIRDRDTKSF